MKQKIKTLLSIISILALTGCASTYYLEGKEYKDAASFQKATDKTFEDVLASISPLPAPLTGKSLVFVVPSEATIYEENVSRHKSAKGVAPIGMALDQYRNLSLHASKAMRSYFDSIQKRGIYPEATFVETKSMVNSIEPSSSYDTLYFTEASIGSGQYFYASVKHGKQAFAYDRSGKNPEEKTKAFLDAMQLFAIRE